MIDVNHLRNDPERVRKAIETRRITFDLQHVLDLDKERRKLLGELEDLNQLKNKANDEISQLLKKKQDPSEKIAGMKSIARKIDGIKPKVEELGQKLEKELLLIPNIPSDDCPIGSDSTANKVVREHKMDRKPGFQPKSHIELGERLNLIDLERASKLSGSFFVLFTGEGARLERALINFMLDVHIRDHGYTEISPPFIVKRHCMQGTGQLPRFEEDMYRIYRGGPDLENGEPDPNDFFLVPTAEVPVTSIHRDEILKEDELPRNYVSYTPCFRLEAGTYGKDTKGLIRVHQFDKVELVKFCRPEASYEEHEKLLKDAEKILQLLEIPYRVVLLSTADLGFAAAKCYDLEVWAPGIGKWLEASSCSNFEDFQARRLGIKYKDKASKKTRFVHTLNASGVALARTFIALVENYQQPDGSVLIPGVLRSYMDGQTHIKKKKV